MWIGMSNPNQGMLRTFRKATVSPIEIGGRIYVYKL